MDLTYQRCPEDNARVITAELGISHSGKAVELGLPEIATALQMKGAIYGVTLAVKGGVTHDFVSRVASGLATQLGEDVHALCPVMGILIESSALMSGGYTALDSKGLVNVYPNRDCPKWMKNYFEQLVEGD